MNKSELFRALLLGALFACGLGLVRPAAGQPNVAPAPPRLPASPLGNLVAEWVEVVNSGDERRALQFIETRFSAAALAEYGKIYPALFRSLQKQGGIELVRVTPEAGEHPMYLLIKSRRGEYFANVVVGLAGDGRLAGIGVTKTENPATAGWPAKAMTEKEMIGEIRRRLAARAADGLLSGAVLVARGDRVLLNEAYGAADREARVPNTVDTRFHLASVGKMATSLAVATLVRAGKMSYDDTVAELWPEYPNRAVAEKVTIRQLLTHSAGFGTYFGSPGFDPARRFRSAAEEIDVYRNEPLFFEPGTKWRYSNAGYSLLGAIVERVSGRPFPTYVRENVLGPLGMKDYEMNAAAEPVRRAAVLYRQGEDDAFGLAEYRADRGLLRSPANGFGGGFATTGDLFKLARAFRRGRFLGPELTATVVTPSFNEQKGRDWGYGIVQTSVGGATVRGHSGGGRAHVALVWDSDYTVIVLTNVTPPTAAEVSGRIVEFIVRQEALRAGRRSAAGK